MAISVTSVEPVVQYNLGLPTSIYHSYVKSPCVQHRGIFFADTLIVLKLDPVLVVCSRERKRGCPRRL